VPELLSIIIPAYNEAGTLAQVLDKVLEAPLPRGLDRELVVVDDCSTDQTSAVLDEFLRARPQAPLRHFRHATNQGKGAALHTGIHEAKGDYILIQDADFEYDPAEYPKLLAPILDGHADVVYGSRFNGSEPHRILFFFHSLGNHWLTFVSNALTNMNLTDMETCYKVFRASQLKQLELCEKRFGFEPEVTAKISRVPGIRVFEVGIAYYGRTFAEGKKINWKDGVRAIWCILKYNLWSK
jgi:glycosyltransferase involved in cell wall biosynthesis